ncbi:MAG: ABC transporter substrate-binding protein [bacterium]|nr:ABC transporter substrate-binding protein [bacterium]
MKKKIPVQIILIPLIFILLIITGLSILFTGSEEKPKTSGKEMIIGKYYWPAQYWIHIAEKKGWFKEEGLNVKILDMNEDYSKYVKLMLDGKMDLNQFVLYDVVKFNAQGADLVVIIQNDVSFGADAIVAKKSIKSIKDLRGKRVAVTLNSWEEYLLEIVLTRNGLTGNEVEKVDVQFENPTPFIENKVQAYVGYEPFTAKAVKDGNGHYVFNSSEIPSLISDVYAVHRKFIEERPMDLQAFVNVWRRTNRYIRKNTDRAYGVIAEMYNVPTQEVKDFTNIVKVSTLDENKKAFSFAMGTESLYGSVIQINNFLLNKGIIKKAADAEKMIEPRFIRNIHE